MVGRRMGSGPLGSSTSPRRQEEPRPERLEEPEQPEAPDRAGEARAKRSGRPGKLAAEWEGQGRNAVDKEASCCPPGHVGKPPQVPRGQRSWAATLQ